MTKLKSKIGMSNCKQVIGAMGIGVGGIERFQ